LKDIYIDHANGHENHLHCLVSLNADQCISKVMQLIKGESSFWINKNKIAHDEFECADEYYAVSISESQIAKVRKYIKNQEDHHKHKTWEMECEEFM
jgi:putative transposase